MSWKRLPLGWFRDGDHSFKPPKRLSRDQSMQLDLPVELADRFMASFCPGRLDG